MCHIRINLDNQVMGIPLYGRTFTLANPSNFGIGAAAVGAGGAAGPITRLVGTLGYNEVIKVLLHMCSQTLITF